MTYDQQYIERLWELFLSDKASKSQVDELFQAIKDPESGIDNDWLYNLAQSGAVVKEIPEQEAADALRGVLEKAGIDLSVQAAPAPITKGRFTFRSWWAAAAILLVIVTTISISRLLDRPAAGSGDVKLTAVNIPPGRTGAVLTLAEGKQVSLDSLKDGVIALQGGATARVVNGTLLYEGSGGELLYNTMSTPKGRQFHLLLPDGSGVWLNSASSIRYPVSFTGSARKVWVTGEAYFEIKKNAKMPFRVSVDDKADIEVIGTSFNVNAYANEEKISATLLEGAISMQSGNQQTLLKPGQQAQLSNLSADRSLKLTDNADIEKVMAWKNGFFNFEGLSMQEVMRQLERWYDIRVQFKDPGTSRIIGGKMDRHVNLSDVLDMFREMGLQFEWDGKTLTIL